MATKSFNKKFSPKMLIIMAVMGVALVLGMGLVKQNQENRSKAAPAGRKIEVGMYVCGPFDKTEIFYCKGPEKCLAGNTLGNWVKVIDCNDIYPDSLCKDTRIGDRVQKGYDYKAACVSDNGLKKFIKFNTPCPSGNFTKEGKCDPKINGVCDTSKENECKLGIADTSPVDTDTQVNWVCKGSEGGTDTPCSLKFPEKINGECSSLVNMCKKGLFDGDPKDTDTQILWTCKGRNNGTDASCSKTRLLSEKVDAKCSNLAFVCEKGIIDPSSSKTTSTQISWTCKGRNGGIDASCNRDRKINGVCDYSLNSNKDCKSGTPDLSPKGTKNILRWNCKGIDGGLNMPCVKVLVKTNGKCDYSKNNGCEQGDSDPSLTDTIDQIRWTCNGIKGGINAFCSRPITPTPALDATTN